MESDLTIEEVQQTLKELPESYTYLLGELERLGTSTMHEIIMGVPNLTSRMIKVMIHKLKLMGIVVTSPNLHDLRKVKYYSKYSI